MKLFRSAKSKRELCKEYYRQGLDFSSEGNYENALLIFDKALKNDEGHSKMAYIGYVKMICYEKLKRYNQARETYKTLWHMATFNYTVAVFNRKHSGIPAQERSELKSKMNHFEILLLVYNHQNKSITEDYISRLITLVGMLILESNKYSYFILDDEASSYRENVVKLLGRITNKNFGFETKEWEKWWKENENEFRSDLLKLIDSSDILLDYFEVKMPIGDGKCSDEDCDCGFPGTTIPHGTGYLYITEDVVEFRKDALSVTDAENKMEAMKTQSNMNIVFAPGTVAPILICKKVAKKRGIDLEIASADARLAWEIKNAPLRATPMAKKFN